MIVEKVPYDSMFSTIVFATPVTIVEKVSQYSTFSTIVGSSRAPRAN
jgi:hypothetical protein